jgi:flagellar hook protein FlgE
VNGVVSARQPERSAAPVRPQPEPDRRPRRPAPAPAPPACRPTSTSIRAFPAIALPFNYADPTTYNQSTAVTTYDSLGNPHTYSMYFVKTAANAWDVYATVTNPGRRRADLSKSGRGGQPDVQHVRAAYLGADCRHHLGCTTWAMRARSLPMAFNLDFSGSTQFGSSFAVNTLLQDGYAAGTLAGFQIGNDGTVLGNYTNGQSQVVGQVVLATFRNPQGLQPLGNNVWAQTPDSGESIWGTPGSSASSASCNPPRWKTPTST